MRVCVQFPEPMGKKLGTVDVLIILGLGKQRQIDPGVHWLSETDY